MSFTLSRRRFAVLASVSTLVLTALSWSPSALAQTPPPGFSPLFNGKDLTGFRGGDTYDHRKLLALPEAERNAQIAKWTASMLEVNPKTGKPHWYFENGELVNDGLGAYATTEKDYGDFELLIDYKTVPKADSGIYLRGVPQVQIWDFTEKEKFNIGADKGSGGLWNNSPGAPGKDPAVLADKPFGEWNAFRIVMVGSRVSVWLNGKQVVKNAVMENYYDRKLPVPVKGPIQLQTHGGEIRWRNAFVREIPAKEANEILAKEGEASFKPVFNGKDFTGWSGPLDNYEIVNGAIGCKAGKGDTAYDGMCELQVLDDNYEKATNSKIDPRQAHGSAYGMAAAARGFQRPIGEWNYQEVTVKGSRIKVELNGFVILDADLSTVKDLMANSAHPGKDRTRGHFGFAGHNDPVMFRNVRIQEL